MWSLDMCNLIKKTYPVVMIVLQHQIKNHLSQVHFPKLCDYSLISVNNQKWSTSIVHLNMLVQNPFICLHALYF